jgi:hypothetical protein
MELSWVTRIKVTAVLALGIVVWGVYIWHFLAPDDPMGAVTLAYGRVSATSIALTMVIAFAAGFLAYFLAWPYGREIGILAVPAGLAAWAARSGGMGELMQTHSSVTQRYNLYRSLGWEGFAWLAIAAAGYCGTVFAASVVPSSGVLPEFEPPRIRPQINLKLVAVFALSVVAGALVISVLAQNVGFKDKSIGTVLGQPANGQVAFASMVAFGLAAFFAKRFWDASYIWPAIATAIVSLGSMNFASKKDTLTYMTTNWPAVFFPQPLCAVLPIQIVSFGILGSVIGYWLAVRFSYWQTHHSK